MPKVIVVSQRGRQLSGLVAGLLGDPGAEIVIIESLSAASGGKLLGRASRLVLDLTADARAEMDFLAGLGEERRPVSWLAVLRDDSTASGGLLRRALSLGARGVLLDPFDLEQAARALTAFEDSTPVTVQPLATAPALATVVAGLAHQILNPVQSVAALLQILLQDARSGADSPHKLASEEIVGRHVMMQEQLGRISGIIRELEQFSSLKAPRREPVDLGPLADELALDLAGEDPAVKLELANSGVPRQALVLGDRDHLAVALSHLARFAAGVNPRAEVSFGVHRRQRDDEDLVEIEILGSAPIELPRDPSDLFVPFHDMSLDGRSGGLELPVAYGILVGHRGTLAVSRSAAGGVCFRACLPATSYSVAPSPP